jgi:hypothetical protein
MRKLGVPALWSAKVFVIARRLSVGRRGDLPGWPHDFGAGGIRG